MTLDERLIQIRPGKRQLEHQKLEFYAFIQTTICRICKQEIPTYRLRAHLKMEHPKRK